MATDILWHTELNNKMKDGGLSIVTVDVIGIGQVLDPVHGMQQKLLWIFWNWTPIIGGLLSVLKLVKPSDLHQVRLLMHRNWESHAAFFEEAIQMLLTANNNQYRSCETPPGLQHSFGPHFHQQRHQEKYRFDASHSTALRYQIFNETAIKVFHKYIRLSAHPSRCHTTIRKGRRRRGAERRFFGEHQAENTGKVNC